jgi:hypothetical protein
MVNDRDEIITVGTLMYVPATLISFFAFLFGLVGVVNVRPLTLTAVVLFAGGIIGMVISLKALYDGHCL